MFGGPVAALSRAEQHLSPGGRQGWRLPLAVLTAFISMSLSGCAEPNAKGSRIRVSTADAASGPAPGLDGSADVERQPDVGPDATSEDGAPSLDTAPERDAGPADQGSAPDAPPDPADAMLPVECTPRETTCSTDGQSVRRCNDQGRWTVATTCDPDSRCSASVCVCRPGSCDQGAFHFVQGFVADMAAGGRSLFMALEGNRSSIRQFDLDRNTEQQLQMGGPDFVRYSLDADPAGNLAWCSEVLTATDRLGQVTFNNRRLDTGWCLYVRTFGDHVYYLGEDLYRRSLDGSDREVVSRDANVWRFEVTADHLYFVGAQEEQGFLRRISLRDFDRVDILARRLDSVFRRLVVDGSHVYLMAQDRILRVPAAGSTAEPEVFWHDGGPEVSGMAQTASHLYWSTSTPGVTTCTDTRVLRQAKIGGPPDELSVVRGHCGNNLVILGDHVYTAIWSENPEGGGPSQLLRIRL